MKYLFVLLTALGVLHADVITIKILKDRGKRVIDRTMECVNIVDCGYGKTASNFKYYKKRKLIKTNIDVLADLKGFKSPYKKYKLLNKKEIKKRYIIDEGKLYVWVPDKQYIAEFIIEAKPDRPKLKNLRLQRKRKYSRNNQTFQLREN